MHFTQKWLHHLLLTITKLVPKCARGINEQLLKTSGGDVLSSRKNKKKSSGGWGREATFFVIVITLRLVRFFNNIFQTAFECAMKAKTTFEKVTTDALDILSSKAPAIGLNKSEFQNEVIFCRFWSPRPML